MTKKLYLAVTPDQYELPLAVADSPAELAKMLGVTREHVLACLAPTKAKMNNERREFRFRRVALEEEEEED